MQRLEAAQTADAGDGATELVVSGAETDEAAHKPHLPRNRTAERIRVDVDITQLREPREVVRDMTDELVRPEVELCEVRQLRVSRAQGAG